MSEKTGKKFDERSIREWSVSPKFSSYYQDCITATRHLKKVRMNKAPYSQMEDELLFWIAEMRTKHAPLRGDDIRKKARELSRDPNFQASSGWFWRFCKRSNLRRRLPTHHMQKIKDDTWRDIITYFEEIRSERIGMERNISSEFDSCVFINVDD